jgi:outer membrane immunogenic protein
MNRSLMLILAGAALAGLFTVTAGATIPGVGIGVKAGLNFTNTSGDNWFTNVNGVTEQGKKTLVGFVGGGFVTLNLTSSFAIQPEILFTQKGAEYSGQYNNVAYKMETRLNYLEIPILFQVYLMPQSSSTVKIFAGPALSLKLSSSFTHQSVAGLNFPTNDDFSKTDWGTVLGAGLDFGTHGMSLSLEARYTIGLQNLQNLDNTGAVQGNSNNDLKNGVVSVMVGLGFQP